MQSKKLNQIIKSHPLAPLMVLSALLEYSKQVAESSPSDYSEFGIVHPETWIQLGRDIHQQLTN
jgi:hypothetical protein